MNFKSRVVIVEEDKILLDAYSHMVNNSDSFVVAGSYTTAEEAIDELIRKKIEIVILDINLPGIDGIRATEIIKTKYPHIDVIINTRHEENEYVISALKAGASGYITKSSNYLEIIGALNELINGGAPISPKIAKTMIRHFHINSNSPLSKREREVLSLMSTGKNYVELAGILVVSPKTARTHIRNIYSKLQVTSRSQAIKIALDNRYL